MRHGLPGAPGWDRAEAALGPLGGVDLLDLGCGTGSLARLAVARGASSVLALDLDPARLDEARRLQVTEGGAQHRIHYEQADLDQATLPFEAYDVAYCAQLIARLDDPVRLARMVRAGLRQRGRLVLTLAAPVGGDAHDGGDGGAVAAALRTALFDPVRVEPWPHGPWGGGVVVVAEKPPRGG